MSDRPLTRRQSGQKAGSGRASAGSPDEVVGFGSGRHTKWRVSGLGRVATGGIRAEVRARSR